MFFLIEMIQMVLFDNFIKQAILSKLLRIGKNCRLLLIYIDDMNKLDTGSYGDA